MNDSCRTTGRLARPPAETLLGPGKNAALSFAAFAAIFGIFAYAERDTTVGHASVTHDISGAIGTAVGKTRNAIMTLPRTDPQRVSPEHRPAGRPRRTPVLTAVPPPQVASTSAAPEATVPPLSRSRVELEARRLLPHAVAKQRQSAHAPPDVRGRGTHRGIGPRCLLTARRRASCAARAEALWHEQAHGLRAQAAGWQRHTHADCQHHARGAGARVCWRRRARAR